MDFFNDTWADYLQLTALPLEVIGFFLSYTELFNPTRARKIEELIDNLAKIKVYLNYERNESESIAKLSRKVLLIFLLLFFTTAFFILVYYNVIAPIHIPLLKILLYAFLFFFLLLPCISIIAYILSKFIDFLNYLSGGKAIGSFGFILASIGVIFEVYQVTTLLKGW